MPAEPLLFLKPPSSLLAPGGTVVIPVLSQRVDFEGEIAVVIGTQCSKLSAEADPSDYIRGYTIANDVTARDLQKKGRAVVASQGFRYFLCL